MERLPPAPFWAVIVPLLVSVFAPSSRATTRAASIEVSVIVPALVKLAEAFTTAEP